MEINNEDRSKIELSLKISGNFIGEETVNIERTVQDDAATWPEVIEVMYNALKGMGYILPNEVHDLFGQLIDRDITWKV